jgi:hypothetical protein
MLTWFKVHWTAANHAVRAYRLSLMVHHQPIEVRRHHVIP